MMHFAPWSASEERLLHLFQEVMPNIKTWYGSGKEKYIDRPIDQGNYVKVGLGTGGVVLSAVTEFPDYVISGVIDQKLEPPVGVLGRTRRDIGVLLKDVVTLRPIRVVADASRLAFTDIPMDTFEAVTGLEGAKGRYSYQGPALASSDGKTFTASTDFSKSTLDRALSAGPARGNIAIKRKEAHARIIDTAYAAAA